MQLGFVPERKQRVQALIGLLTTNQSAHMLCLDNANVASSRRRLFL